MSDPVLAYEIAPMREDELPLVMDSWLRGSFWGRNRIQDRLERGTTLVARQGDVCLGWMTVCDGKVCHSFVKVYARQLGVCRALWKALGEPRELDLPKLAQRTALKLMRRVQEGTF